MAKSKEKKPKKPKEKMDPEIKGLIEEWVKNKVAYKIKPTPFLLLSVQDREKILASFESFLNTLEHPTMIYIDPFPRRVIIDDEAYTVIDYNYYIITDKNAPEPANFIIEKKISEDGIKDILIKVRGEVDKEKIDHLILKVKYPVEVNGEKVMIEKKGYAKSFVIYSLGYDITGGILLAFAPATESMAMVIEPIPATKALSYLPVAIQRIEQLASMSNDIYISRYSDMLHRLYERVKKGEKIHKFTFIFNIVSFPTENETMEDALNRLNQLETEIRQILREDFVEINSPAFLQKKMFYYNTKADVLGQKITAIKPIYADSYTITAFFPFISDEIRDENGIFLGINPLTGGPITYNPLIHKNKNIVILGDTGSGKSMTTKVMIRRMLMKWPELRLFVLDPEGEYAFAKEALGKDITSIDINPEMKLGLDPLRMAAKGMISELTAIELLKELFEITSKYAVNLKEDIYSFMKMKKKEGKIDEITVPNFVDYVLSKEEYMKDSDAKANYIPHIKSMNLPPASNIFAGDMPEIGDRVIFNLHDVQDNETKKIIGSLISAYLNYQALVNKDLGPEIPKLVVVDEAWIFSQYRSVMYLFADISRRGRKRTVVFMFVTQRPNDVLANEYGRTVVELAETTILLGMQQKSINAIVENDLYNLSENDIEFLKSAKRGAGILRIGDIKTPVQIKVTSKEFEAFNTERFKEVEHKKEEEQE